MKNQNAWIIYRIKDKKIFAVLDETLTEESIIHIVTFLYSYLKPLTLNEMLNKEILTTSATYPQVNKSSDIGLISVGSESDFLFVKKQKIPFKVNEFGNYEIDVEKLTEDLFYRH